MVRLFGVDINPQRTKKRKSVKLFGQEIIPERRKSAIKKTRTSSPPVPLEPLPPPVLQTIGEMEGNELHFITRKILEWSDTAATQHRFFIPKSELLWELLSEEEKMAVEGGGGLRVVVVDRRGEKYSMKLKKWASLNVIVLNSGWWKFVDDNKLKEELDCMELWSFRADSKLCFAFNVSRQLH